MHSQAGYRGLLLSRDVTAVKPGEAMRYDFVVSVAHEIRTPLTVLSGLVETLQTPPPDDTERANCLALIAQHSRLGV